MERIPNGPVEDVRCEIGVRAAGVQPAALGHVHAQRDVEEQQRDGDGDGDEQQEWVERQQGRTEPESTAGHIELGRVDEQVLQDDEWQQQQGWGGGGGVVVVGGAPSWWNVSNPSTVSHVHSLYGLPT